VRKLSRAGVALAGAGLGLLASGMATGNVELIVLACFPLALLGLSLASPRAILRAARTLSTRTPRRGDAVDVEIDVFGLPAGAIVETHASVPDGFELESGTNLALHSDPLSTRVAFRVRAHARGKHPIAAFSAETVDPRGLLAPEPVELMAAEPVEVTPRPARAERLRRRHSRRASALPGGEDARLGAGSMDFRELRDYAWGDPPKAINWRATARRLSAAGSRGGAGALPLVNDYEKEGRATMIVLLDGGAHMRIGTTLETGLDHAVEAALTAARIVLDKNARVGAATFGARAAPPAAPEAGRGQMPSIERALAPGEAEPTATATHALASLRPYIAGARPLVLVVTRVTSANVEDLVALAQRLRVQMGERRRALPLLVLDVRALGLAPARTAGWEAARAAVEAEDAEARAALAAAGARLTAWRPEKEDVRAALVRRGLA
jgi:uncharacterized protein (DUF58 family)